MKIMSLKESESKIISDIKSHIQVFPFDNNVKYCGYKHDSILSKPELKPIGKGSYKIFLTKNNGKNDIQSIYQLAHELIHQIAPVNKELVNYFEEGMATWYQIDFVKRYLPKEKDYSKKIYYKSAIDLIQTNEPKYYRALQDIEALINQSAESIWTIVNRILLEKQNFSDIDLANLKIITNVEDEELLSRLCCKFYE